MLFRKRHDWPMIKQPWQIPSAPSLIRGGEEIKNKLEFAMVASLPVASIATPGDE